MIPPKTNDEIASMTEGGRKLGIILSELLHSAQPGVTLESIEAHAQKRIAKSGGTPSFQMVKGYRWATCLCVNDVVVHGVPSAYVLKDGDVLTIDIGLLYKGLHTDAAWTKIIQNSKLSREAGYSIQNFEEKEKFLKIGEEALRKATAQAREGNRVGHISKAIQETIEGAGYSIVKSLVGHGVGRQLHEAPPVPGFLRGSIDRTEKLASGMTLAIEVIYAQGRGDLVYENDDGWSIATHDGKLSAVFEHTIAIATHDPLILTRLEK